MVKTETGYLKEHLAIEGQIEEMQRQQHADFWRRGFKEGWSEGHAEGLAEGNEQARRERRAAIWQLSGRLIRKEWPVLVGCACLGGAVVAIVFGVLQLL